MDLETKISHMDPRVNMMMNSNNSSININGLHNSNHHHSNGPEDRARIEENLKLRESLLQAFKQQIKLRKNALDLDNAIMDINIEAERHNKIIEK